VGEKKAKDIIRHAVFVLSMGTNDFLQNYFLQSMRTDQFSLQEYQNFLVSCMSHDIEVLSLSLPKKINWFASCFEQVINWFVL